MDTAQAAPREASMAGRAFAYWMTSYRRTWRGTLFSGFLSPVLYLAAMGFGLGTLVDAGSGVGGVPYVAFVAPGVLAATAMQTAIFESTYPVLGSIKWMGHYHAQLATPLSIPDVLVAHLAFVMMRVTIACGVFLLVAALLWALESPLAMLALPVAVLCGLAHAGPVFAVAARSQQGGDDFNVVFRFVMIPLFLFAGTFFPISQLPVALQAVAWLTPLAHATELCRQLTLGAVDWPTAVARVAYLALWAAFGYWLARRGFFRRLVDGS